MKNTKKNLVLIQGGKLKANERWIYCPKCRKESTASIHILPVTCVNCGHKFEEIKKAK